MGISDIASTIITSLDTSETAYSISDKDTEDRSYTPEWSKWHGHYREIPELQSEIDKLAFWAAGKGIKAKEKSRQNQLDKITGFGKDTIRDIAMNMIRVSTICGDSLAEIVKDKRGALLNVKPLNPGFIEWETNARGRIIEYRQFQEKTINGVKTKLIINRWIPEDIFHLCWQRIADENHGISTIEKLQKIIIQRHEAQDLMQLIFRRMLFPVRLIEVDTDDDVKMTALQTKYQNQIKKGEVLIVPMGTTKLSTEQMHNIVKDSIEWLQYLSKYFILAEGVPEVILGSINSRDTEGASKILYLAFEQVVKNKQNWFEEQWKSQIGFEIDLPEPPSIDPMILMDSRKSGSLDASKGNNSMSGKDAVNPSGANK